MSAHLALSAALRARAAAISTERAPSPEQAPLRAVAGPVALPQLALFEPEPVAVRDARTADPWLPLVASHGWEPAPGVAWPDADGAA